MDLKISQMIKNYGTSSQPWWVRCNDDEEEEYVVKFLNPNKAFANEFICYKIADKIGLTTTPSFAINIEQNEVDMINKRKTQVGETPITVGKYFFSKKIKGSYTLDKDAHNSLEANAIQNLELVPGMIAFDIFVNNGDRSPRNAIIQPVDSENPLLKYVLIDHGHCFNQDSWNKESIKNIPYTIKPIPWKTTSITNICSFIPSITALNSLDESFFKQVIDEVPPAWKQNKDDFDALLEFLKNRDACKVLEAIMREKDKTNSFVNWK